MKHDDLWSIIPANLNQDIMGCEIIMLHSLTGRLLSAIPALIFMSNVALAADDDWKKQLNEQMSADKQCSVQYMTNVRETTLAGQKNVTARVHCADGRSFDATRLGSSSQFDVRDCEPQVC